MKSSPSDRLLEEAAQWVSVLNTGSPKVADNQAFLKWINASTKHQQAYQKMKEAWQLTSQLDQIPEFIHEVDQHCTRHTVSQSYTHLLALTACLLLIVGALSLNYLPAPYEPQLQSFSTAVGETKRITLEDGSTLSLNTDTQIDIRFTAKQRYLKLVKGEALFNVASNPNRPFIVNTGDGRVHAVGTAFNIKKQAHTTAVTITEGVVLIETNGINHSMQVTANHHVTLEPYHTPVVNDANITHQLAWQNQQLIYSQAPLKQVIEDLNRYLTTPVSLTPVSTFDKEMINGLKVDGTLNVNDPEEALAALLASFNLELVHHGRTPQIRLQ
ncbi:FecR family protein [Marinagarivorans algicola]|uniref:FecR family protein n=1 Tax=Marinagarivorans algicola TaxID=1513270 RepID=UPI00155DD8E8|nr:FecR domain-containing protein [Marinagarivorans algicola]